MTIIHEIKDNKDFSLLLTCPMCLKSLVKNKMITDKNSIELLKYKKEQKRIIDNFNKGQQEYEVVCPNCRRFNIIYRNCIPKIRDINKTGFPLM